MKELGFQLVREKDGAQIAEWIGLDEVPSPIALPSGQVQIEDPLLDFPYKDADGEVYEIKVLFDDSPVTGVMVDAERDRRRYLVMNVSLPAAGAFPINMDLLAQSNLQGLSTVGLYLNGAAPGQKTEFRDADNKTHELLPGELVGMGLQVAGQIQTLYQASWALKAMRPIPLDYMDDKWWSLPKAVISEMGATQAMIGAFDAVT